MSIKFNPTFLLKGIDLKKIREDYNKGLFNRENKKWQKIKETKNLELAPQYGTSNLLPIYSLKDKNNHTIIVATTNNNLFDSFIKTNGTLNKGGRCSFCKQDFEEEPVGSPVSFEETVLMTKEEDGTIRQKVIYTFWVEGIHCGFECALANTKDPENRTLLKLLYRLTYPDANPLVPANDYRLLNSNGGPLTREQWNDKKHCWMFTPRVLMIPAKAEFFQQIVKSPFTLSDKSE